MNFNGTTTEAFEWISNFIPHIIIDVNTYPFKFINVSKRGYRFQWMELELFPTKHYFYQAQLYNVRRNFN